MDMEMIQYHPTTLAGLGLLITEGARGEGAHLYNAQGERFMEKYAPNKMELASRDVVSRAEQTEINEGRGFPDGTVALDITVVPRKRIHEALREIVNVGRDFAGVDITREPIHIKPGNHYTMGGIRTDVDGRTSIPGLYAAGECACVSVHGGNRLGANSLLDTLVFGRRSGKHAAQAVHGLPVREPSYAQLKDEERRIDEIVGRTGAGRRVSEVKAELGATMDKYVAVFRDEQGLNTALETVRRPQGGGRRPSRSMTRARSSTRTCSARSSSASCSTTPRRRARRARAQGEPWRPIPDRLIRSATTTSGSST
jgi:succinate dehydrogenase / fumarate reductase flavoprotein subunit